MPRLPPRSTPFPTRRSSDLSSYPRLLAAYVAADGAKLTLAGQKLPRTDQSAMALAEQSRPSLEKQRSEEHTSELQSLRHLVCRLLLEKKKRLKDAHSHTPTY